MQPNDPITNDKILITGEFTAEKTNDVFKSVVFIYDDIVWEGAIPKYLERQGIVMSDEEISERIPTFYENLNPINRSKWIAESDSQWADKESQTYKVLNALYSGEWECRVHGPVPEVNPQPAARLKALKTMGYVIGSQRRECKHCGGRAMHDILIMLPAFEARFEHGNELRKPMSDRFKERTKSILKFKEVCFGVRRSSKELIIDHKFPSQRWGQPESDNPDDMPESQIRHKFQLLSNQTNMWKSRYCDRCVKENIRGDFMDITWFYEGNAYWQGADKHDENGCVGCPWYDLERWKDELNRVLNS
ncbi:hypothetical protein F5984_26270 [Rudanella paleaurantiibacter]|uniref:Restriction endonuclease n=1 Tax=Rudanella paleaurantiibacter TaxID=2614655 RepID=A0A7J5TRZ2_9BACT|nr:MULTISPECIES: hypothetical protein [Rudanella]KAB7725303.1 hypothetical protein F5984_26270 [Rudanella paleaurantiibacter]